MKKIYFSVVTVLIFAQNIFAQVVNIPNANFKKYLIENTAINTNNDTEIQLSEANAYSGEMKLNNLYIQSLVGIEAFVKLTVLDCYFNSIQNLDLSKNVALKKLDCYSNNLTSLDLSKNVALVQLSCGFNGIKSLDISKNIALTSLGCGSNQLTSLDLTQNKALTYVGCFQNSLKSVNLKNGKNTILKSFDAIQNPSLTCIQVDNINIIPTGWKKDATASYGIDCFFLPIVNIPDSIFKNYLVSNLNINYNGDLEIQLSEAIAYYNFIIVNGKGIKSLVGIEAFSKISRLLCDANSITSLDLSKNVSLIELSCNSNQLTSLDLSKNIVLQRLNCSNNQLKNLDFSNNTVLSTLICSKNKLETFDVGKNISMFFLDCEFNKIPQINLSKNVALYNLRCGSNQLTSLNLQSGKSAFINVFDALNNPKLSCIQIDDITKIGVNWVKDATATYSTKCTVSDDNFLPELNLILYPNPTKTSLSLHWEGDLKSLNIEIFNSRGALVLSQYIDNQSSINIENFPKGLYFCQLKNEGKIFKAEKIIIE